MGIYMLAHRLYRSQGLVEGNPYTGTTAHVAIHGVMGGTSPTSLPPAQRVMKGVCHLVSGNSTCGAVPYDLSVLLNYTIPAASGHRKPKASQPKRMKNRTSRQIGLETFLRLPGAPVCQTKKNKYGMFSEVPIAS